MSFNDMEERPSTLSRLHKGRLDKPRTGFLSVLAPVCHVTGRSCHVTGMSCHVSTHMSTGK